MISKVTHPELIIGIVGAVGTDLKNITLHIEDELKVLGYKSAVIKASKTLTSLPTFTHLNNLGPNESDRLSAFMEAGDTFREKTEQPAAIAAMAITAIRHARKKLHEEEGTKGDETIPKNKCAYIINSLKRPEEIKLLREIYGETFIQFSVYSPKDKRIDNLAKRICKSINDTDPKEYLDNAKKLISRDEKSGHKSFGQNVQDAFTTGDFFIKENSDELIREQIHRVLNLFFGHPFITPSVDEFGLYFANAAAKRSSDLSRQVGAAILSRNGDIISVGCNDVPKVGGGIPWEGDPGDYRDFKIGRDQNVSNTDDLVKELFTKLNEIGWLSEEIKSREPLSLAREALYDEEGALKGTRVASLLEFGRVVHAEMNALMDATRQGLSVEGATLYCTTFPCHMCARHIIASGIKRVVFVEPYPKSMAETLYSDLASVDEDEPNGEKVVFNSFVGISPNKYNKLFEWGKRKTSDGYAFDWSEIKKEPKVDIFRQSYIESETVVVSSISELLKKLGQG